jgi:hypothetical protein
MTPENRVRLPRIGFAGTIACLCSLGCSSEYGGDDMLDLDLGVAEQELQGGLAIPNNTVAPYSAAVVLEDLTVGGIGACSGVKVADRKYVTAGHCVNGAGSSGTISIDNDSVGGLIGVNGVFTHPTWILQELKTGLDEALGADVGVITTTSSNTIPANTNLEPVWISTGGTATVVGYGSGVKRYGSTALEQFPTSGRGYHPDAYYMDLYWEDATLRTSPAGGDSGSPVFRQVGGTWQVIGILSDGTDLGSMAQNSFTASTRMSNVKRWIDNPAPVVAANNVQAMLINSLTIKCANAWTNTTGEDVVQYSCMADAATTPNTYFTLVSTGVANEYQLRSKFSLCLGIEGNVNNATAVIEQQTCSSSNNYQKWQFTQETVASSLTAYKIRNKGSSNCLSPDTANQHARLRQYTCPNPVEANGLSQYRWVLTR